MSLLHYFRGFYLLLILVLAACGGGGGSAPPVTTAPGTPVGVMAAPAPGDQSISVTWDATSGATSYNIYWSFNQGTGTGDTQVSVSTPVFNHSPLTNGTPYYYVVTAVNSAGESSASVEVSATPINVTIPATPTGVAASAGFESTTAVWDATSGATSYNVYWSTTPGTGAGGTQVSVSNPVFHHSPLANGTPYYYVVTAVNSAGESSASLEVSAMPDNTASNLPFNDINLENCVNVNIITTPADLTSLSCINLGITDIGGIEALTNLNSLVLFNNNIIDISPLAGLTGLTTLRAGANSVSDISSLSGLTNLITLTLEFNSISDIGVVSNFVVLTHLDLRNNNITSLSALSLLTTLTTLILETNTISDISPLSGLINVNILNLGINDITDIGSLLNLTALTSLSLYNNTISDISVLSNKSVLSGLNLFQNNISDASSLSLLTSLTSLNIAFNNITDVSVFAGLTGLIGLDLRSNGIGGQGVGNVDSLTGLTSASSIFLLGNTSMSCIELASLIGVLASPPVDTDSNLTNTDVATNGVNCTDP